MGQGSRALFPQYGQFVQGNSGASPVQIWSRHQLEVRVGKKIMPIASESEKHLHFRCCQLICRLTLCLQSLLSPWTGFCVLNRETCWITQQLRCQRAQISEHLFKKKRKKGEKMLLNKNPELCLHVKYEGGGGKGESKGGGPGWG